MAKSKFYQVKDGEWVTPTRRHKMGCCDCRLVHDFTFRIVRIKVLNGRRFDKLAIQFKASRNIRATAGRRTTLGIKQVGRTLRVRL